MKKGDVVGDGTEPEAQDRLRCICLESGSLGQGARDAPGRTSRKARLSLLSFPLNTSSFLLAVCRAFYSAVLAVLPNPTMYCFLDIHYHCCPAAISDVPDSSKYAPQHVPHVCRLFLRVPHILSEVSVAQKL